MSPGLVCVEIPIAFSKNLISHFESLLYADQESYKKQGDVLPRNSGKFLIYASFAHFL